MKRILIISDLHCGHLVGLTPPGWQLEGLPDEAEFHRQRQKIVNMQRACWHWYADTLKKLRPFDIVIANGDLIDGRGERSGGTEQAAVERFVQCDCAVRCIKESLSPKTKCLMSFGTPYHVGQEEDFEAYIAKELGAKIGGHEWLDIEGVIFDIKHHVASSAVPHGRHTAVARDHLWNTLWAERTLQPKANVIIRSHVHYYSYCGGVDWTGMTTPALQAAGTKYGARRCSGLVDFGFVTFTVDKGTYSWTAHIPKLPVLEAHVTKL